jgi:hypothetical protein
MATMLSRTGPPSSSSISASVFFSLPGLVCTCCPCAPLLAFLASCSSSSIFLMSESMKSSRGRFLSVGSIFAPMPAPWPDAGANSTVRDARNAVDRRAWARVHDIVGSAASYRAAAGGDWGHGPVQYHNSTIVALH